MPQVKSFSLHSSVMIFKFPDSRNNLKPTSQVNHEQINQGTSCCTCDSQLTTDPRDVTSTNLQEMVAHAQTARAQAFCRL